MADHKLVAALDDPSPSNVSVCLVLRSSLKQLAQRAEITSWLLAEIQGSATMSGGDSLARDCFASLCARLSDQVGAQWADELREAMECIETVDDLLTFFGDMGGHLGKEIARDSVAGVYVRECVLALQCMGFSNLARFFDTFQHYRDAGLAVPLSRLAMLRIVRQRVAQIEADIGRISFDDTESLVVELESIVPDLHHVHYLRALNCLFHRELEACLNSAHRFFDGVGHAPDDGIIKPIAGQPQHATLFLALIHARFGHFQLAHTALQETVRAAQQQNDKQVLIHALALLCHLTESQGNHSSEPLYKLLSTGAHAALQRVGTTTHIQMLDSHTWLALAKWFLLIRNDCDTHNEPPQYHAIATRVWEATLHALAIVESNPVAFTSVQDTALLLRATAWKLFGNQAMSQAYNVIPVYLDAPSSSAESILLSLCNSSLNGVGSVQAARELYPYPAHNALLEMTIIVQFNRAVEQDRIDDARNLALRLRNLADQGSFVFESNYVDVQLAILEGRMDDAYRGAIRLSPVDSSQRARALLALATALKDQPEQALTWALHCDAFCRPLELQRFRLEALVLIADFQHSMRLHAEALSTVEKALPRVLECSNPTLLATAYTIMARCLDALSCLDNVHQSADASDAMTYMQDAYAICHREQLFALEKQVVGYLATWWGRRNDVKQRDAMDARLSELEQRVVHTACHNDG